MSGLEGPAGSLALRLAIAAGRRFARTTEFERLCGRLAERFSDRVPYGADDYAAWAADDALAAALGRYTSTPHQFDRAALVAAITPLVGALDDDTSAETFAGLVADAIRDEVPMAKTGDELVRFETDRIRQAIDASSRPRDLDQDVSWAPIRAHHVLRRLLQEDPDGFAQLSRSLKGRELSIELKGLVGDPPRWLTNARAGAWESIGRLCEITGLWPEAQLAYEEAVERPGAERANDLIAASGAAGYAGDTDAKKELRRRAEALPGGHPMVELIAIWEEDDPDERLRSLEALGDTGDQETDGLIAYVRTITLLDVGDIEAAEQVAAMAKELAPWSPVVREAAPAVVVARNRERRLAGHATERGRLLEAAEEFRQLRDDLRMSRRFAESGGMLERVAECQTLADRGDLARVTLREALDEELAASDIALRLAETAVNAGDPDLAEVLLGHFRGSHPAAELMRAHLALRHPERRQEAVTTLDRLVAEGGHEAAYIRLIAAVPATDEVPWSNGAEAIFRKREPVVASFVKSEWYERRGRSQEASRELARHADDPRALKELMLKFAERKEWAKAAASARALLTKDPDLRTQVLAARVLELAGDEPQSEALLRGVIGHPDVHDQELREAFEHLARMLVHQTRLREAIELAESLLARGYADAGWVTAYVLARQGRLPEARERITGLTPRSLGDASLAVDLHFAVDPPTEALRHIIELADGLDQPDENVELKATLALLRAPPDVVTEELIERAGPVSFVDRFPHSNALRKQELVDDNAAFEMLREHARRRAEVANAAEAHVLVAGDRPVGTLAFAVGGTLAEVWAQLRELPLGYEGASLDDEIAHANAALGDPVVVETGALHSLHLLGAELTDVALSELPLSMTAHATIEDLIQATMPPMSSGDDVVRQVGWDSAADKMVVIETTPEEAETARNIARLMQQTAGRLQPAPRVEVPRLEEEAADLPVVRAYAEIAELAQIGHMVYTDDRWFRATLATAGIASFGSVALLAALRKSHVIDDAQHTAALATLRSRGALGLPPSDLAT